MMDLRKDYRDYLALLSFLIVGLLAFVYFGYNRDFQRVMIVVMALFYILWGVVHHQLKGDFHLKVFLEYLVIALFAVVLVLTLLARI